MVFLLCGLISNDNSDQIALSLYRLAIHKDFFLLFITGMIIVGIIYIIICLTSDLIIRLVASLMFYEWLGQKSTYKQ